MIVATGRYLGEPFDDQRLATLFLSLPIAWRGTLAQYPGRLDHYVYVKRYERLFAPRGPRLVSAKAVVAHLGYLERDGVNRDGEKGQVYSAERDAEVGRAFLDRGRDDRPQFRFIVFAAA